MPFDGFQDAMHAVFEVPDFAERMRALKGTITPQLKALGQDLVDEISHVNGGQMYAHVAQHLRRRVNSPVQTWVAFSRGARSYKPFIHYRIGLTVRAIRVEVHIDDMAGDQATLVDGLRANRRAVAEWLTTVPGISCLGTPGTQDEVKAADSLGAGGVGALADELATPPRKALGIGVEIPRADPLEGRPDDLERHCIQIIAALRPFYRLGAEPGVRL